MGCIAVDIPITIYEGGTFDRIFQWKSGETPESVNLTGYTGKMMARSKITDADPLVSIETALANWEADGDSGIYFDDAADGKYRVYINDEDAASLCEQHLNITGVYDMFLYSPDGESVLKQYGVCTFIAANTRA